MVCLFLFRGQSIESGKDLMDKLESLRAFTKVVQHGSFSEASRRVGIPVSSVSRKIGTLEHVLQVPELDIFDGIVVATRHGLRFIDADHVGEITRNHIRATLSDAQASELAPPDGPPVYRVDALQYSGHNLHDYLGRMFGRPHWKRERD